MLNSRLVLLLLVLHSALSLKKDTRLGKKPLLPKLTNCEKIKCPPVERPVCAKLVYRNAGNKTVYVVMINECEMNYVKCHEGLEAIIAPMGDCGHEDFLKTGRKRSKRQLENDIYQQVNNQFQEYARDIILEQHNETPEPDIEDNGRAEDNNGDAPAVEDYGKAEDNNGDTPAVEDYGRVEDNHGDAPAVEVGSPKYEGNTGGDPIEDFNAERAEELGSRSAELIIFGKDIEEVTEQDIDDKNENVNIDQYYADCPTVCPSRDVMVCAKCQHGVYRTFLTICHMRMFSCRHRDEKLQLISRLACVMSAPYLSDPGMQPQGRVQEPTDDDRVMRFIRCRELSAKSREEDSRCQLKDDKDTRLYKETSQISDDY